MSGARSARLLAGMAAALAAGWAFAQGAADPEPRLPSPVFELIGELRIPPGTKLGELTVGGLSGITYDPVADRYYAVSDDRSRVSPARFFTLAIDLADGRLDAGDLRFESAAILRDTNGEPFAPESVDPEAIARDRDGTFLISSEGVCKRGIQPFVRRYRADGSMVEEIAIPEHYLHSGQDDHGVRPNLGFEILGFAPGWSTLFTATENALYQDGPQASVSEGSPVRILEIDPRSRRPLREYVYPVDPVVVVPDPVDAICDNGLSDILVVDPRLLVTIERSYSAGRGFTVRLYLSSLERATNVLAMPSLKDAGNGIVVPVTKQLILDLREAGVVPDNIEGITFGPTLADGRRVVILISDDNFNPAEQVTQVVAFAVSGLAPVTRPPLAIAAIQGRGHRSPLVDQWVDDVAGVVTAVDDGGRNETSVWIQEADDGDQATSAALQVVIGAGSGTATPKLGDALRVSGRVRERAYKRELPVTQLEAFAVTVDGHGRELPPPLVMGRGGRPIPAGWVDDDGLSAFEPASDAIDYFESLEGMRVQVDDAVVVGPTSRGQMTTVLADRGEGSTPRSARGGLVLTGDDLNPERVQVDTRQLAQRAALAVGDRLAGATVGVLSYSYGSYKLIATEPLPAVVRSSLPPEVTALGRSEGFLTVATYNLENLAASASPERFERAARVIAHHLGGPELVALEEVQDDNGPTDDGTVSAAATLARLTAAVSSAGGPRYEWCQIDPDNGREGGQPGGNIRVVLLYDPTRVEVVRRDGAGDVTVAAGPALVPSPGRVAMTAATAGAEAEDDDGVRKPLAVELRVAGRTFFVVVVHLSSKIGDDREFGDRQPPRWVTEEGRTAQATFVREVAERILDLDPAARVIVLGDFNELDDRPPLQLLTAGRLTNLVATLPRAELYSHTFNGNGQQIDHILVSPGLVAGAEVDVVHCNIDLPAAARASDHDPVVARVPLR